MIKNKPKKPLIKDDIKRKKLPNKNKGERIETIKWYMKEILLLRKKLLPLGSKFEDYYIKLSENINEINDFLKFEFKK